MMKKYGFMVILQVVIITVVLFTSHFIEPLSVNVKTINNSKNEVIEYCIKDVLFFEAEQLDHTYEWITLAKDIPLESSTVSLIKEQLHEEFSNTYDLTLLTDQNFYYRIKVGDNTNDKKWNMAITQEQKEKAILSATIKTDKHGKLLPIKMNSSSPIIINNDFKYLQSLAYDRISMYLSEDILEKYNIENYYQYQLPKNLEMEVYIPESLKNNQEFLFTTLVDYTTQNTRMMVFASTALVICLLLGFILPLSLEKEAKIFTRFLNIKVEVMGVLVAIIVFLGFFVQQAAISIFDGQVEYFFRVNKMSEYLFIVKCGIGILFYCVLMFTAFFMGYIKNFFHKGIKAFIKDNTCIYALFHFLHNINFVNFKNSFYIKLLILILIHVILNICFSNFRLDIMYLWILLESIAIFGFMVYVYNQVMKQYDGCLKVTKQLANGNFNVESISVPTFQSLYENLIQIKQGFSKALDEGIQSQNVKTELITNVSHDLKTPLTGLKNYVELLQDDKDPAHMDEYIQKIVQYTNRLDQLVVDLFDVSKANAGALKVDLVCVDVCEMIRQVQAEYATQWQDKDLATVYKLQQTPAMVMIDPNKMVRVFENLIQNISRYALDHTRVFIEVKEEDDHYKICYKNTSKAPLDFNPEEITERFVRGDKSRHEVGSGLGLAIVKSFTEIQGGIFAIEIDGDLFKAIITLPKETERSCIKDEGNFDAEGSQ